MWYRLVKCKLFGSVLVHVLFLVQALAQEIPRAETNTTAVPVLSSNTSKAKQLSPNPVVPSQSNLIPSSSEDRLIKYHQEEAAKQQLELPQLPKVNPGNLQAQAELPFPRVVEKKLELLEFRDIPLSEALRLFSKQTGIQVVASAKAGEQKISAYLENVTGHQALSVIVRANGLFLKTDPDSGILAIYTQEEYDNDLTSFREEDVKVFTLLYPNSYDVAIAIRDLFGEKVFLSFGDNDINLLQDLTARFTRFDLIDQRNQGALFGGFGGGLGGGFGGGLGGLGGGFGGLGGFGGIGGGFGTGIGGVGGLGGVGGVGSGGLGGIGRGGGLGGIGGVGGLGGIGGVGTGFATNQGGAGQTGATQQSEDVTIYVTAVRKHNQIVVRTSDPKAMARICDLIQKLDVPTPLVLLEVKILVVDLNDDFESFFDYQFSEPFSAGGFSSGNIIAPAADVLTDTGAKRLTSIALGGSGFDPTALLFQYVTANFRFRLQLLETKNRITEVATPTILTANNEVSRIFIGQTQPITVGFTPGQIVTTGVATANTVQATPITQLVDVGTQLLITPNINADRTVTLRITQQTSRVIEDGGTIPLPDPNGGVTDVDVDIVAQQTYSGTIVAKDGLAIAIGGLIEEGIRDNRAEVPVLGRIPYVGVLFRRQMSERFRRERILVIRPYVFYTPVESAILTKNLLKDLSFHPLSPHAQGGLNTFAPQEILQPNPPLTPAEMLFRVHMFTPKDF